MSKHKLSAIDTLDTALQELKSYGPFADDPAEGIIVDNALDKTIIARAWQHLEKEGFAYTKITNPSPNRESIRYYITLEGMLAIENCPFFYKGRPYKWKAVKAQLTFIWNITTIMAIIVNALIIMIFTYLTYIKSY